MTPITSLKSSVGLQENLDSEKCLISSIYSIYVVVQAEHIYSMIKCDHTRRPVSVQIQYTFGCNCFCVNSLCSFCYNSDRCFLKRPKWKYLKRGKKTWPNPIGLLKLFSTRLSYKMKLKCVFNRIFREFPAMLLEKKHTLIIMNNT